MADDKKKTYIWVRPTSLQHQSIAYNTPNKKRRPPEEETSWDWTPGYYISKDRHHYTLISFDGTVEEYTVEESHTARLLASGDLVLANDWEENDFTAGLLTKEEEEYNYDESSDGESTEKDEVTPSFVDKIVDAPPENLIELTHLHEPSVVYALRHRYKSCTEDMGGIYTDTGPILLAVNPFKADETEALYGEKAIDRYRIRGEIDWLERREGEKWGPTGQKNDMPNQQQRKQLEEKALRPHVYSMADRIFRTMMSRLHPLDELNGVTNSNKKSTVGGVGIGSSQDAIINQSVLVSGESGAGKTVTTKLIMNYLAELSKKPNNQALQDNNKCSSQLSKQMSIQQRVLDSNPIMESFGNARTVRNDNSSRFGKYIEMKFRASTPKGVDKIQQSVLGATLTGGSIETYLLEKVRLVHQSPGERNYHIFYELFSLKNNDYDADGFVGMVVEESDETYDNNSNLPRDELVHKFGLEQYDMHDFSLINSSGTYDRRDGVTDSSTFADLCRAMSVMGFKREEQIDVFAVTSALLHASNVTFKTIGIVECTLEDSQHLDYVLTLLEITKEALNYALCYHTIVVRGEIHKKVLSMEQAKKGIEALIKAMYGTTFNYLVEKINASVSDSEDGGNSRGAKGRKGTSSSEASIGILDIFGFESFRSNSFEQFCINYCNEALQQQFNRFILRNEQEEYHREDIPWSYIEFPDNQDVLDLIDRKGAGIIDILDDQCRTPGATDKSFSMLMYDTCNQHSRFKADPRQVAENMFAINHYAGLVEYSAEGFIEKNKDEMPKAGVDLLLSSTNNFIKDIATDMVQLSTSAASKKKLLIAPRGAAQRATVGIQFSAQLHDLRRKIGLTSPHYIRCLKPNNMLVPDLFDASLIGNQLRCAGVIEAVRVSRLGYSQRYCHSSFITRYRVLGMRALSEKKKAGEKYNPAKTLVHTIAKQMAKIGFDSDIGIQVGKTKIFLRRNSFDILEELRTEKISSSSVRLQSFVRRIVYMQRYKKACTSILSIQCFVRKVQAKTFLDEKRRQYKSVILQKTWRRYIAIKILKSAKFIGIWTQVHYRGNADRAQFNILNRTRRAVQIQTCGRRHIAMKKFRQAINFVVTIQCARRSYLSRQLLSLKKAHARDLDVLVEERNQLRFQVNTLRNELLRAKASLAVMPDDVLLKISEKDIETEYLQSELERLSKEKDAQGKELFEAKDELVTVKSTYDAVMRKIDKLAQLNKKLLEAIMTSQLSYDELDRWKNENARDLEEATTQKPLNGQFTPSHYIFNQPSIPGITSLLNVPHSHVIAEILYKLERGLWEISQSKDSNKHLPDKQPKDNDISALPSDVKEDAAATNTIVVPGLSIASIYSTTTTDNMTADTEDEISKLREENQVLRTQLELLRDNQNDLPDLVGKNQEFGESVNLSESASYGDKGDQSSDFARICSEVEEATEDVIMQTRAELEANISQLESKILELQGELRDIKISFKHEKDDLTTENMSLRIELEETNEDMSRMHSELEAKTDEFDALNEDVEKFAETFATQYEEAKQLERQVKHLQDENNNLKLLDDANRRRIIELQNESIGKADSADSGARLMWKELAKMRKEIASMQQNQIMSANTSVQNRRIKRDTCSSLSSDDDEEHNY